MSLLSHLIDNLIVLNFKNIKNCHHIYQFTKDELLIQAGHIPHMSFRLLTGSVVVFLNNRLIGEFGPHTLWGHKEILEDKVSPYTVGIKKGSTVCAIGKSELRKKWMRLICFFEQDMLASI